MRSCSCNDVWPCIKLDIHLYSIHTLHHYICMIVHYAISENSKILYDKITTSKPYFFDIIGALPEATPFGGLSLGRVHINSCDFSLGNYCFDSVEEDFDLEHFDMQVRSGQKNALLDGVSKGEMPRFANNPVMDS